MPPGTPFIPAQLNDLGTDVALSSVAHGDLLYRGASKWNNLGAGTAGKLLKSAGVDANPAWSDVVEEDGALKLTAAPPASATLSRLLLGNALSGGSANGTWLGVNAANGYTGDFANWQVDGDMVLRARSTGAFLAKKLRIGRLDTLETVEGIGSLGDSALLLEGDFINAPNNVDFICDVTHPDTGGLGFSEFAVTLFDADSTPQTKKLVAIGIEGSYGDSVLGSYALYYYNFPHSNYLARLEGTTGRWMYGDPASYLQVMDGQLGVQIGATDRQGLTLMAPSGFASDYLACKNSALAGSRRRFAVDASGNLDFYRDSTGTVTERLTAAIESGYVVDTDSSRTGFLSVFVADFNGVREAFRVEGDGTEVRTGFMGASPVVRQTVDAAATDAESTQSLTNSIRTALINLGLCV